MSNRAFFPESLPALLGVLLLAGCGGGSTAGGNSEGGPGAGGGGMPPPLVTVAEVRIADVTVSAEYPARVRGARAVEVRAQVGGVLVSREFLEGAFVEEGEVLFRIEPDPYEIALRLARAEKENAEAALRQAEREWRRLSALLETSAVSQREHDQALSDHELAQAGMAMAESRVAAAELDLEYTRVRASVSGIVGLEAVSEGNLIQRGEMLVRLVQVDPVQVRFSLPEPAAAARQRALRDGDLSGPEAERAEVIAGDGVVVPGHFDFMDAVVDPETGSRSARITCANPEGLLVPGQFVRVRIPLRRITGAGLVPPEALGQGEGGTRVFVVGDEGLVEERVVVTGPVVEGGQVIEEGLRGGERVVVNGQVMLQGGMPVTVAGANGGEDPT